jgi:uncharacterized protein Yka (UPF0111/DUF47 family)
VSETSEDVSQVDPETKKIIWRLDRELKNARKYGAKAAREMHKVVLEDVRRAQARAREAEKRARQAERRADAAERELAAVRSSNTWKAGRVVVGVPARIKTGLIKNRRRS